MKTDHRRRLKIVGIILIILGVALAGIVGFLIPVLDDAWFNPPGCFCTPAVHIPIAEDPIALFIIATLFLPSAVTLIVGIKKVWRSITVSGYDT